MSEKIIVVIDATGGVLGRVASLAAKQALYGKEVFVVNCEHALVTGDKKVIIDKYKQARARGGSAQKGPFFPKSAEKIMKRTIRGMLDYKEGRGYSAFKRVKCYNAVPKELEGKEMLNAKKPIRVKTLTLKRLGELM